MRKFAIGIVSLAVALGVFVLYSRMDKTPPIISGARSIFSGDSVDSNSTDTNNIGKIGDVGIAPTEKFEYINRNLETGEIDLEFGFEKLLHAEGEYWEVEQPYMNIYREGITCNMKAERGLARVEKIGEDTIPKDATFSGNVVINILPGKSGAIEESTIYLDNLAFISEKSQLSTNGNLRFVSKTAQLSGTGMELIYNNEMERLELFRIVDVNSLKVKIRRATLGTVRQSGQSTKAADLQENDNQASGTAGAQKSASSEEQYYTCLFRRNVLIDTPDERVFAAQDIQIDDIIWSTKTADEDKPDESSLKNEFDDPNHIVVEPNKPYYFVEEPNDRNHETERPEKPYQVATEPNNPDHMIDGPMIPAPEPNDLIDVVVTCDNGLIVAPKDSRRLSEFKDSAEAFSDIEKQDFDDGIEKTTLLTQNIKLTTLEGDSLATGLTELTFYVMDTNNPDPNLQSVPVTITSQNGAKFIKAANQVVFEGDSLCKIPQKELSEERYITFASPMLIINLPKPEQTSSLPDIIAIGPTELEFYVEDSNAPAETQKILPVRVTSQEKALFLPEMNQVIFDKNCLCQIGSEETGKEQYVSLKSSNLRIDLPGEFSSQSFEFADITAAGPVDLKFYMKDPNNMGTPQSLLPVSITARKQACYLSSSRQIIIDGSCRNTMRREEADFVQELNLLADTMTVDLPKDANSHNPTSSLTEIRHLNADGKQVKLTITKKVKPPVMPNQASNQVLGGSELICKSLDYDTQEQVFLATGPGELTLSDTEIKDSNEEGEQAIFGRKWWAKTYGFSSLEYLLVNNRIIANSEPNQTINIQYIELEDEEYSPVLKASAGHVEIQLTETEDGKLEPSTVVASGGIECKTDEDNLFLGSVLIYSHENSIIKIHGDEKNPCYYNGLLVDEITINLKDNSVKFESAGPSSL